LPLHSQILGKTFAQMPITTPISTSPTIPQLEKSGPPIKAKSSVYLWPDFYYITLLISLLFFHSSWPSIIIRPSPQLLPLLLDSQQELILSSKLVDKPFESNHHQTFL